jgi:hypothetical protein
LAGIIANCLALSMVIPFFSLPVGMPVKPMTLPCMELVVAAGAVWAGIGPAARSAQDGNLMGFGGLILCLSPLPLSIFLLHLAASLRDLKFG